MRRRASGLTPFWAFFAILLTSASVEARDAQAVERAKVVVEAAQSRPKPQAHPFWDRANLVLFAGVGVTRALDYTSTGQFRARGYHERVLTDSIADNKPLFISIQAAGVAASIGVAYWLHKTGRHKLERWLSVGHIGVGNFLSIWDYNLRGPVQKQVLP